MLLQEAAPEQQRPNLLLAAVHFLVLSRASEDPLAAYFPSVGGNRSVDSQLRDAFASFCSILNGEPRELIATRTTQTNEIGRCAVLWPILQFVVMDQPQKSIALLDFGCSAGLNLGVDRFQYQYNMDASRTLDSNVPIIKCQWHGSIPPRSDQKADVRNNRKSRHRYRSAAC
jgi:hypothetical protein